MGNHAVWSIITNVLETMLPPSSREKSLFSFENERGMFL
jgi:hypothetical protein